MATKTKKLQPIIYKDSWHRQLSVELFKVLREAIYGPIEQVLEEAERHDNAKETPLERALKAGTIRYYRGAFEGKLSAHISKELKEMGARWYNGKWRLPLIAQPPAIREAAQANLNIWDRISQRLDEKFQGMMTDVESLVKNMSLESLAVQDLDRVSREFKKTVASKLSVETNTDSNAVMAYVEDRTKPIRKTLFKRYEDGSKEATANFAYEEITKLRADLSQMITDGAPRKDVRKYINSRLKVGRNRAKFIARQETALLTNKIKEDQYKTAGIRKYRWMTFGDGKVRQRHRELNKKIISWDNPPIVNEKTGQRAHAGDDFGCRCQQVPIVEW